MGERVPIVLSTAALVVALLGSTPVGSGVRDAVASVVPVPFAKRADRAKVADNALKLNGRASSTTPRAARPACASSPAIALSHRVDCSSSTRTSLSRFAKANCTPCARSCTGIEDAPE